MDWSDPAAVLKVVTGNGCALRFVDDDLCGLSSNHNFLCIYVCIYLISFFLPDSSGDQAIRVHASFGWKGESVYANKQPCTFFGKVCKIAFACAARFDLTVTCTWTDTGHLSSCFVSPGQRQHLSRWNSRSQGWKRLLHNAMRFVRRR
jgi:hypothetical protein